LRSSFGGALRSVSYIKEILEPEARHWLVFLLAGAVRGAHTSAERRSFNAACTSRQSQSQMMQELEALDDEDEADEDILAVIVRRRAEVARP
jgi:hypothetical protein